MDAPDGATSYRSPASGSTTATLTAAPPTPVGPFTGGGLVVQPPATAPAAATPAPARMSSPFSEALVGVGEADEEARATEALLAELEDEEFEEAVDALVDEIAARHLRASPSWSSETEADDLAAAEAEAWAATLTSQADRYLERLERELADRPLESLTDDEIGALGSRMVADDTLAGATEQLFGSVFKKVVGAAKGIVKTGIKAVKGIASLANIVKHVRKLVPWLIRTVVNKAINRLPARLRGPARQLALRFGAGEAEASIAEEFDARLASALLAPDDAAAERVVAEAEVEAAGATVQPLAALDAARARLVSQLAEAEPDQPPEAEIEQFIPAVMAVVPALRAITAVVGRDKITRPAARLIAGLIKGHVGPQAANALAPVIADVGLKLIGLEAEADDPARLGAEALAATVEDTIREVAGLPDEAASEPLRLQAEVEQAFSDAAARHLPPHALRPDLPAYETDDGEVAWVAMPRAARPRFRYRKCSRVYRVPISRPRARAIVLSGEDTLEERLLDAGVAGWPVEAEVHVYEALPGSHPGHLAAYEVDDVVTAGESATSAGADEFEDLTPEVASLLVGQPGLGRRIGARGHRGGRPLRPGQRLFRVVVPGVRVRRRRPRLVFRLDAAPARPTLRVHLRLTEREADRVAQSLARNAHPAVVALLRGILAGPARRSFAERLDRQAKRRLGAPLPAGQAAKLAEHLADSMLTAVAKQLPSAAATLAAATRDPAPGVTLTFAYTFVNRAAVSAGAPDGPALTIRPGQRHD
jgi:hypothetical protein